MALTKPVGQSINAFDARQPQTFSFVSKGGDLVVKNKLVIKNNETNEVVYQKSVTTYQFQHVVPANTLKNNQSYSFYFVTYDSNNNSSPDGLPILFYCYTSPTLEFVNMPSNNIVPTASFEFQIRYNQIEKEPLDFASVSLYSTTGQELYKSDNFYNIDGSLPVSFFCEISGFQNHSTYNIQATARSINGTVVQTKIVTFVVQYQTPEVFSQLDTIMKCNEGYVQVISNLNAIDGEANPNPPEYIDNEKAYLLEESYIKWRKDYSIPSNFSLQIWMNIGDSITVDGVGEPICILWNEDSPSNKNNGVFIYLNREIPNGYLTAKDYVSLKVFKDGVEQSYAQSNYVDPINNTTDIVFRVRKVGITWSVVLETTNTKNNDIYINGDSNVVYYRNTSLQYENEEYANGHFKNDINYPSYSGRVGAFPNGLSKISFSDNIDSLFPLTYTEIMHGVYDHIYITKDTTSSFSTNKPSWDYNTILSCGFEGNIFGGNLDIPIEMIKSVQIKRRIPGEFEWLTLYTKEVHDAKDLNITLPDSFIRSGETYQWAFVPIFTNDAEGDYIISQNLKVKLNGTFITDGRKIFKLHAGVIYSGNTQNIKVGSLEPIGRKYPVIIQNSILNYTSGSVAGDLYGYKFENDGHIDIYDVSKQVRDISEFLTDTNAKIVTDWNGNTWLVKITAPPSVAYNNAYGNGIARISFEWSEQGYYNNQTDLDDNNLFIEGS